MAPATARLIRKNSPICISTPVPVPGPRGIIIQDHGAKVCLRYVDFAVPRPEFHPFLRGRITP
jgi:hypothetical protein